MRIGGTRPAVVSRLAPWQSCRAGPSPFCSPISRARRSSSSSFARAVGNVLAEHQRLLREAFAAHDGHEIDTQGDAFFVAFASAREAVLAAVEGQRALSGYPWPDNAPVKVRMGIHTGQAVPVNGRYTGVAVHRASRICNAGHGGQVLISQATQTLLEDEEEDLEVGLRDLGQQRLKDLDRPVQLYQIAAPGLAAQFPPLREEAPPEGRGSARSSLPAPGGARGHRPGAPRGDRRGGAVHDALGRRRAGRRPGEPRRDHRSGQRRHRGRGRGRRAAGAGGVRRRHDLGRQY